MSPVTQSTNHKCNECQKRFQSESAKNQHSQMKHPPKAARPRTRPSKPPSSASVHALKHRDIVYSTLSAAERSAVGGRLSALCHSEQRLLKEGYILPVSTETQNEPRPTPRTDLPCPDINPSAPKTAAIVLDCEMAGAVGGENELIQITMLDFLSGRILLSCLVNPSKHIVDWREDITGINAVSMQEAVAGNKALHGWEAARAELWRFADKETILIGQSVHNDLKVLHTSHSRIIDSAVVTADAALGKSSKIRKRWGLETLCYEILGIQIRKPSQTGGRGVHDALEDAFATRELVLLCAREPNKLKRWAKAARAAFFKGNSSKRKPQGARRSQTKRTFQSSPIVEETDSTDDERLRWEDVVDPEVWPKSPPDSD